MSRMKHLLRKLHLSGAGGGGGGAGGPSSDHHRPRHRRSVHPPLPPPVVAAAAAEPALAPASAPAAAAVPEPRGLGAEATMTRLDEEYQVRLALAISASDPAGLVDPDSVQIRAAERISLGGAAGGAAGDRSPMEALSARYWNHNVVNYDEKLSDGFYDVCGVPMHPGFQVKFPSLGSMRAVPVGRDAAYVAVLVNRERDPVLKRLEGRAMAIATQNRAERGGVASAELVQKIASLVVDAMGGPVEDADGMNREWTAKSRELCAELNSIVLPLGSLRIGLSHHRSLLFKVWLVAYHMVGVTQQWYIQLERDEGTPTWLRFKERCHLRFSPPIHSNPLGEITRLRMSSTVADYQEKFLALLCRAGPLLSEQQVQLFTSGLTNLLHIDVELQILTDLQVAMSIARAYEQRALIAASSNQRSWQRGNKPFKGANAAGRGALLSAPPSGGGLGAPSVGGRQFHRLTAAEMAERREKGLCFNCDEKFIRGHRCVYCLEVVQDDEEVSPKEPNDGENPHVSLYALIGICAGQTMQVRVRVGETELLALIDSGSTHSFLQEKVVNQLGITLQPRRDLKVTVANGE